MAWPSLPGGTKKIGERMTENRVISEAGPPALECFSRGSLRFRVLGLAISASIDKICVFYSQPANTLGVGDIEFCV